MRLNMKEFVSPVYNVIGVPVEKVQANDYNPNRVAPPEMKLLELSIWEDGFTQPIVCYYDKEADQIYRCRRFPPLYDYEDQRSHLCPVNTVKFPSW